MAENIDYQDDFIMETFKQEVHQKLGEKAWDRLTEGIGTPDARKEASCNCNTMRQFMLRFDEMTEEAEAKEILMKVRHGLKHSQFEWAKVEYAKFQHVDEFIQASREDALRSFQMLRESGETFYGQEINDDVLAFVEAEPGMLSPVRKGRELHITAFPNNMAAYLKETDDEVKRYHACHCPFAKESLLPGHRKVSKSLCYCSLGHAKVMWEAIFNQELEGEVLSSVLNGGLLCKYVVYLPEEAVVGKPSVE